MAENEWLREYYQKAAEDKNVDLQRKDSFTNWALVSVLGLLAVYGQFPDQQPSFVLIAVTALAIALVTRFYVHSCISYANIRKLNTIIIDIEKHWMEGKPSIDEIKKLIRTHGQLRWSSVSRWKVARTQMKAGFLLLFIAPIAVLIYEMTRYVSGLGEVQFWPLPYEWSIIIVLSVYMIYEFAIFFAYTPLIKKSPEDINT